MTDTSIAAPPPPADAGRYSRVMLFGAIIASLVILNAYAGVCLLLFFFEVPEKSIQLANNMFQTLQTLAILAAGYWLGSSSSSAARAAATPMPPPKDTRP